MKNMLFDFWGTLAYLTPGEDFGAIISNTLGIDKERYLEFVKSCWFTERLSSVDFAKALIEKFSKPRKDLEHSLVEYIESPIYRAKLYPEVSKVLHNLSLNKNLYLVSDTSSIGKQIIENLDILKFFNQTFLSFEHGLTKKEGLYNLVFKTILAKYEDVMVIGDSLESDYYLPRQLGVRSLLVDRNEKYAHTEFDRIKSLNELK